MKTMPWSMEPSGRERRSEMSIYGQRGTIPVLIAEVFDKEDAEFLLKAASTHADLLAAAQAYANLILSDYESSRGDGVGGGMQETFDALQVLIERAK